MKLLFIDDEPHNVSLVMEILQETFPQAQLQLAENAQDSIDLLSAQPWDLVIMDIFLPLGKLEHTLGRRAEQYHDNLRHLGGLAILDFVEKMPQKPKIIAHTACTDYALIEVLGSVVDDRIPKPAPLDMLLQSIQRYCGG